MEDHPDNISAHQHHSVARNAILKTEVLTLPTPTNVFDCVGLASCKDVDKDRMTAACYDPGKLGNISALQSSQYRSWWMLHLSVHWARDRAYITS